MASKSGEGEGGALYKLPFGLFLNSLREKVDCIRLGPAQGLGVIFALAGDGIEANIELDARTRLAASGDVAFHFSDFSRSSRMRSSSRFF